MTDQMTALNITRLTFKAKIIPRRDGKNIPAEWRKMKRMTDEELLSFADWIVKASVVFVLSLSALLILAAIISS